MNTSPTQTHGRPTHPSAYQVRPGSAFEAFTGNRDSLILEFLEGNVTNSFQEDYSEIMDLYFRMTVQESMTGQTLFKKRTPFALVAVGGYGRRDLCIHSDIDILILFNKKIPSQAKALSEELFFPLWDAGLELGYGVRTIKDCLNLSKDDFEVLTSLMDIRFICGDSLLYLDLTEALGKKVVKKSASSFIKWLNQEGRTRMETFGDASHLLEPNLKEGIGGLRDYHHILWMAKAFLDVRQPRDLEPLGKFSTGEYNDLRQCIEFIHLVRNHLHELSGRKNDRLNFEYQEKIAKRLGYKNIPKFPAVEQFLSKLHSCMESVKTLHRCFLSLHAPHRQGALKDSASNEITHGIRLANDELDFKSAEAIKNDLPLLMDIFDQSCRLGVPICLNAMRRVKDFLPLIDDGFRRSPRVVRSFLNIINGKHTAVTLDQMFETGLLDSFIPEFGEIKHRVQFDAYHIFPVGRHVLETVSNLKNLSKEKTLLLTSTYADLKNHEHLFLSGLFHDIGKNGKGHAKRGVHIARTILERMGYPEEGIEEITFQIAHHLILAEISTRRDLDDEKIIIQTARTIGDIDRLKMLYLLTWADSRATGPRAWNEWTANLVQELFFKSLHILERGELATPDSAQRIAKLKAKIKRKLGEGIDHEDFERIFETMPTRYKLSISPKDIVHHMDMSLRFEKELKKNPGAFILDVSENKPEEYWQVSFVGKDRPGLFSDLAGAMALNNINILSSNIFTWRDGAAVDIFYVTSPLDPIHSRDTWEKIKSDLKNTFSGKISLAQLLSRKAAPSILSTPGKPSLPPDVVIDNDASDFFTLIEVFASDRIGLLYLITRTLFDLHLDIRIAKIGVKGDQIADVFYVRDLDGQKIEDEQQVNEIKRVLLHQLSRDQHSLSDVRP